MAEIYLDYNATAPLRPEVVAKISELLALPLNASSVHGAGQYARKILEQSRSKLAEVLSVFPREIIFTGSGTEANNLALKGFSGRRLLVSAIEHASVLKATPDAARIPVDGTGIVRLDALDALLKEDNAPALISIILANNESGVIQPIAEISEITRKYGVLLHTDAVQALGKIPLDMGLMGADMLTISAHKCGGPVGAAALVVRGELRPQPLLAGGGQEQGRRAGTENIAAIAGFALAAELAQDFVPMQKIRGWLDVMEKEILKSAPEAIIFAKDSPRLPNTSCISMPGVASETQLLHFDLKKICISAGSACSSGRVEPSHVLLAMGAGEAAKSAIRVSAGWNTKEQEISAFTDEWVKLYTRLSVKA